jgi:hypothetical protein
VTIAPAGSTTRMNSLMTRYGVIGASAEFSFACHFASHASRLVAISSAGERFNRRPPSRSFTASVSAASASFASPSNATSVA